jgi:Xaa-Pro aminopeptidase
MMRAPIAAIVAVTCLTAAAPAAAAPAKAEADGRFALDLDAVQGLLAVQRLDGWLLYDFHGQNRIAEALVAPAREADKRWFYFVPAEGEPALVAHRSDLTRFADAPGRKIGYTGYRDLERALHDLLRGKDRVAMEFAPSSGVPGLTRVDPGTVDLVRSQGVKVVSSADLVQFTKSIWGPNGRVAHYVAAHHLERLYRDAIAFIAARIRAGRPVTEYDVQQHIVHGYDIRGIAGPPPVVATSAHATCSSSPSPVASSAPRARSTPRRASPPTSAPRCRRGCARCSAWSSAHATPPSR